MTSTYVDLRFTDARGSGQTARVTLTERGAWVVQASIEGRPFSKSCRSWQSVERTIFWLRRHAHESPMPPHRWVVVAAAAGLLLLFGVGAAFAERQDQQTPAVRITEAARQYAPLHRQLQPRLPKPEVASNPATISRAVEARAAAMRAVRRCRLVRFPIR